MTNPIWNGRFAWKRAIWPSRSTSEPWRRPPCTRAESASTPSPPPTARCHPAQNRPPETQVGYVDPCIVTKQSWKNNNISRSLPRITRATFLARSRLLYCIGKIWHAAIRLAYCLPAHPSTSNTMTKQIPFTNSMDKAESKFGKTNIEKLCS